MQKPKLVLSNTSTFFGGRIESVFRKAQKAGIKYLEIVPYRWLNPERVLYLEKKYAIQIAGIHMPQHWDLSWWQIFKKEPTFLEKFFGIIWHLYMGQGQKSPGVALAHVLKQQGRNPYLLFHTNVIPEIPEKTFKNLTRSFHVVIENIPYEKNVPEFLWNLTALKTHLEKKDIRADFVFDPAHYYQNFNPHPPVPTTTVYKSITPKVVHIGYLNGFFPHTLPNKKEQEELEVLIKIHSPQYITIETNPSVNVEKGKLMIENIINKS